MMDQVEAFIDHFRSMGRELKIYDSSIMERDGVVFFMAKENGARRLCIVCDPSRLEDIKDDFLTSEKGWINDSLLYMICPCNSHNASSLRRIFQFLNPKVIGLTPAIGTGDRIGLATPGHIRAIRKIRGIGIVPVLAQQSIREMERTCRSPQDVMDDVVWAVFQEGYKDGFAADADHLKTEEDVIATFKAGFTMYTIDPSDYVDDGADRYDMDTLKDKFKGLPWEELGCNGEDYYRMYLDKEFEVASEDERETFTLSFSEEDLLRASVKYSSAIAHTLRLKRRIDSLLGKGRYDLEMSVDETETPTRPIEHIFIALELRRLGIKIQGLALRFVGRFEKAIDYIGDLKEFEDTFRIHVLIAKNYGPYKLSIHSGSDKFSIYPIIGRVAGSLVHLKTAGTSYLESLRLIVRRNPELFREIVKYSMKHFEDAKRSYHISTELSMIPDVDGVPDGDLEETFLNSDPGRQLLHVTYGAVLTAKDGGKPLFLDRIKKVIMENEEEYYEIIRKHIERHIEMLWSTDN